MDLAWISNRFVIDQQWIWNGFKNDSEWIWNGFAMICDGYGMDLEWT